ncbi:MAG: GTPase Era [Nitrospinae bacterium RIFCSPLOWO2_12_FULL_47_7]|nr:MAG: GTPase Era [Nitrospinae bacterium RIFCSPLOWO2_12_FULL_47_7]
MQLQTLGDHLNILTKQAEKFKSGFVGIIGKPNVGKSTLLNQLISDKVAATSNRPQTTRNKITAVCHVPGGQIILLDTPGIHKTTAKFNYRLVKTALNVYNDIDLILFLIDAQRKFNDEDQYVLDTMRHVKAPKILVVNKIDLVAKPEVLPLMAEFAESGHFLEIVPVSALTKEGLDSLRDIILKHLPEGPEYFPKDMVTDCPENFIMAEIIREKIMRMTHMELPHAVAVAVESIKEGHGGVVVVDATIYVEKVSQRKILIGEKGSMLKKLGSSARQEIEKRFGNKVYLNLFIKVKKNWKTDDRCLQEFGFTDDSH